MLVTESPDCLYDQTFSYEVWQGVKQIEDPLFIPEVYAASDYFGIDTSESADQGTYTVEVFVTQDDGTGIQLQLQQSFELKIECPDSGCGSKIFTVEDVCVEEIMRHFQGIA